MTTVLVGWDEAKCRPIYRRHYATTSPPLEQHQSQLVEIVIHDLVLSRKNNEVIKIAMNTVIADSSTTRDVVPRRKRGDRAISNTSNRQHERVSLSPLHNIVTAALFNDDNEDDTTVHVNHATSQLHRLFNNNNNSKNSNKSHRISYDAVTRWTKKKRRYGKNKVGVSLNNNNMSHTIQMVDDVLFVINDSIAIIPSTDAVNCNDGIMMIEEEGGGEHFVFNDNNDGQEGRSTIDESSRSATSSSLLHGNRERVGDCNDRHRHNIQRIPQEIDPLVDHPLQVEYQCKLEHPKFDKVTNSNNDVKLPEIVQHTYELVITTSSSKQLGEADSFSNENKSEEDNERYELDEYDTPSIFNPMIEDSYLIQSDANVLSQLHYTTILTQDDDITAGFDKRFAIDKTGSTSCIHPSKGERRRGSTYGDGKPVWTSSKLISSVSLNGPRSKIKVGWDDDKGRPIYRTTECESNSLSNNNNNPCLLPSTRPLDKLEVGSIPKQRKQKKKVYSTLFKKTGLSHPLLHDPPFCVSY